MPVALSSPSTPGPMYPFARAGYAAKSVSAKASTSAGATVTSSRARSTSRSPGTPIASGSRRPSGCSSSVGWTSMTRTFFRVSAAVHSRPSGRAWSAFSAATRVSIVGVPGVSSTCAGPAVTGTAAAAGISTASTLAA